MKATTEWLSNPEVFAVNRIKQHSDHKCYVEGSMLKQSLNGTWKFTFSKNPQTREKNFYRTDFDIEGLDNITVPGHMSLQGFGQTQYTNVIYPWDGVVAGDAPVISDTDNEVGGYVIDVEVDKALKDKRLFISFQGVSSAFYLYVNDQFVGYSEDSFTPAEFDITDFVKDGKNRIGVEVFQRSTGDWLEDQDFWRLYGIFREVFLYAIPEVHVRDLFIHTNVEDDYKTCSVVMDADVVASEDYYTEGSGLGKTEANIEVFDKEGKLVATTGVKAASQVFGAKLDIPDAKLWSGEVPYLYSYVITLLKAGNTVETVEGKLGLRRFEIKDKLMLINGKRIEFFGVNRHEFSHKGGRVVSEEEMLWDVRFMKQHNINAVRTCHYPDMTRWYELCDEYGIYLIDEANMETHGTWTMPGRNSKETAIPGSRPEWKEIVLDRARSVFNRDKNHPSVIIWSCGNESHCGQNILNMKEFFKAADPSRVVHYEGVWSDMDFYDATEIESRMYAKPWDIEKYLENNPPKPFISCEYSHAMGNSNGGLNEYIELLDKYPMYQGGFIWDYIDQSLEKEDGYGGKMLAYGGDFGDRPNDYNFCVNGLILGNRTTTPKMQEVKYLYQMFNITPDQSGVTIKNRCLFTGTEQYKLVSWLLIDGEKVDIIEMDVDVAPGTEKHIDIVHAMPMIIGEVVSQCALVLKEATIWAEAGHEVAFGEKILTNIFDLELKGTGTEKASLKVVRGSANTGVYGESFGYIFSTHFNGLVSIKKNGKELLAQRAVPCYYRASTDNDRGCNYMFDSGIWQYAEKWQRRVGFEVTEKEDGVEITYVYELPITENAESIVYGKGHLFADGTSPDNGRKGVLVTVVYKVMANGSCLVSCSYPGAKGLPQMPLFGMQFVFNKDFEEYTYYGKGPMDNYIDRSFGARMGIFKDNATDNFVGYSIPQACGNRTEVRSLTITDKASTISFKASKAPFECTVLHYNETQIEEAYHKEELPRPTYTFVKIMGRQMGVGGDDSWGAQVHEQYRIYGENPMEFQFVIEL